jgi:hypothetical protein
MKQQRKPVNLFANRSRIRPYPNVLRTNTTDGRMDVMDGCTEAKGSTDVMERTVPTDLRMESRDEGNGPERTDRRTDGPPFTLARSGEKSYRDTDSPSTGADSSVTGQNESSVKPHGDARHGDTPAAASSVRTDGINYPSDSMGKRVCGYKPENAPESWPLPESLFLLYVRRIPINRSDALAVLEECRDSFTPDKLADLRLSVFRARFFTRCRESARA